MIFPLMMVSPGEPDIAADSLLRLLEAPPALLPVVTVLLNGVDDDWLAPVRAVGGGRVRAVAMASQAEPYVHFGRNLLANMPGVPAGSGDLIVKVDPDSVVRGERYVNDLLTLHAEVDADLYYFGERYKTSDDLRRTLRVLVDQLPVGLTRVRPAAGARRFRLRTRRPWHARLTLPACWRWRLDRSQPAGGFHALSGRMRDRLADSLARIPGAENGLEWNDDTLLPIAVRGHGGKVCDLRETPLASRWRWARGSRYFQLPEALSNEWSILHPLKNRPEDLALCAALPRPAPITAGHQ